VRGSGALGKTVVDHEYLLEKSWFPREYPGVVPRPTVGA
jgi:hypothetical protein